MRKECDMFYRENSLGSNVGKTRNLIDSRERMQSKKRRYYMRRKLRIVLVEYERLKR